VITNPLQMAKSTPKEVRKWIPILLAQSNASPDVWSCPRGGTLRIVKLSLGMAGWAMRAKEGRSAKLRVDRAAALWPNCASDYANLSQRCQEHSSPVAEQEALRPLPFEYCDKNFPAKMIATHTKVVEPTQNLPREPP